MHLRIFRSGLYDRPSHGDLIQGKARSTRHISGFTFQTKTRPANTFLLSIGRLDKSVMTAGKVRFYLCRDHTDHWSKIIGRKLSYVKHMLIEFEKIRYIIVTYEYVVQDSEYCTCKYNWYSSVMVRDRTTYKYEFYTSKDLKISI